MPAPTLESKPPVRTTPPAESLRPAHDVDPHSAGEHALPTDLHQPRTSTVLAVLLVFVLCLAGLFLLGYFPHRQAELLAHNDAADAAADLPIVGITRPHQASATRDLTLPCDIRPNQETSIYPRANGYLKKLYVDIQDRVTEGQLLAEIDTPEVDAQLAQSQGALEQSQARLKSALALNELARRTAERYQDLKRLGTANVTDQELDEKQSAYLASQGAVSQARANVIAAQADVQRFSVLQSYEKVTAPFPGIITARNFDLGALLNPASTSPGKELFHLVQADPMRVFIHVPQNYATDVTSGQPAWLTVRNYRGREFTGTVARSAGALDPATRTMLLELHFPNSGGDLLAGMYGQARLSLTRLRPVLTIPTSAMIFNATGLQVATVQGGNAHFQPITVGRDLGTELEILSGLAPDDQVIANPNERLREGSPVKVMELETPTLAHATAAETRPATH
jgi:membrane fusion protein, multidrug efflux system